MHTGHDAIVGFRPHTGWAAIVVVRFAGGLVSVCERRKLAYEPENGRFVYHHAAEVALQEAEKSIAAAREQSAAAAQGAVASLLADLRSRSIAVTAVGIPCGNMKLPGALADLLAAHSRIHAAEGIFYREVLADACRALNLDVRLVPERDLQAMASSAMGFAPSQLNVRMNELGRGLGPPWGEDQKLATLAAIAGAGQTASTRGRRRSATY